MRIFVLVCLVCGILWGHEAQVASGAEAQEKQAVPATSGSPTGIFSAAPTGAEAASDVAPSTSSTEPQKEGTVVDKTILRSTPALVATVHYPALGLDGIDADVARWAEYMVGQFEQSVAAEDREPTEPAYTLDITYKVEHPSRRAVSLIFEVSTYTGGAHGNLAIVTHTYDTQSGVLLTPAHFFEDLEMALTLMSTYCYERLAEELGEGRVESMLKSGTTPDADNFSTLSLTKGGVRVYFAPYQVAPWSAGAFFVDVPLTALVEAHPLHELWGLSGIPLPARLMKDQ